MDEGVKLAWAGCHEGKKKIKKKVVMNVNCEGERWECLLSCGNSFLDPSPQVLQHRQLQKGQYREKLI